MWKQNNIIKMIYIYLKCAEKLLRLVTEMKLYLASTLTKLLCLIRYQLINL